jgi:hypothetical protein
LNNQEAIDMVLSELENNDDYKKNINNKSNSNMQTRSSFSSSPGKTKDMDISSYDNNNKTSNGLPFKPIPPQYNSVAGGFFILYKDKISWWAKTFVTKLDIYFKNSYLVKDDQIILIDCIMTNQEHFTLFRENDPRFDNWFMFQRILLPLEKVSTK